MLRTAGTSRRARLSGLLVLGFGSFLLSIAEVAAQPQTVPFENAVQRAGTVEKPLLVMVGASWCGPCHRMRSETFTDEHVGSLLDSFVFTELTIDEADRIHRVGRYRLSEREWSERLGAEVTPTFLFLRPDLSIVASITGFLPAEGFIPVLTSVLDATPSSGSTR